VEIDQPIEVANGAELDVTLAVDLSGWFANADGTRLVDPAQALDGQPLEIAHAGSSRPAGVAANPLGVSRCG
jgi:hypothetical protein